MVGALIAYQICVLSFARECKYLVKYTLARFACYVAWRLVLRARRVARCSEGESGRSLDDAAVGYRLSAYAPGRIMLKVYHYDTGCQSSEG